MNYNKYFFVFSTGRCGTEYLAKLLNGYHELTSDYKLMRNICKYDDINAANNFVEYTVLPAIERTYNGINDKYIETSHLLCKGFFDRLLDILKEKMYVIRLYRNKDMIIKSFFDLRNHFIFPDYAIEGTDLIAIDKIDRNIWINMSLQDKLNWYVDEIERQWQKFSLKLSTGHKIEIHLENIIDDDGTEDIKKLELFGFTINKNVIGKKINSRDEYKL